MEKRCWRVTCGEAILGLGKSIHKSCLLPLFLQFHPHPNSSPSEILDSHKASVADKMAELSLYWTGYPGVKDYSCDEGIPGPMLGADVSTVEAAHGEGREPLILEQEAN